MADRQILNQAEMDAAARAIAQQNIRKAEATQTIQELSQRGSFETAQKISELATKGTTVAQKLAKKATGKTKETILSNIPSFQQQATNIQETYINPYQGAMGVLGEAPIKMPAPVYSTASSFNTWWTILRAKLLQAGMPLSTIDKSQTYFKTLATDLGVDEMGLELLVDYFFYTKDYTTSDGKVITSPYYTDFGKFNESLTRPKGPQELVPLVLGYRDLSIKYKISSQYYTDEAITQYLKNDVSISEFDDRLNTASLKAITADNSYKSALKRLGYITEDSQLTDFFLDPKIGTLEMKNRQKNAAFVTEAVRRATPQTGLEVDLEFAKEQAARYAEQGYTEAQISTLAATGYENIAEQLPGTVKLSQIYETPRGTTASTTLGASIQSELQQEEFRNITSSRKRKLYGMETAAYKGSSGVGILGSKSLGAI